VDRVLVMRRAARAEADRAELIRIIQELEKRCQVVVNRDVSAVLKDVPSWKSQQVQTPKPSSFRGGIRTWAEIKRHKEKAARAGTDKVNRRAREFEQVMNGTFAVNVAGVQSEPAGAQVRSGFHTGQRPAEEEKQEKSDGQA
jgi:hypothetical protein